GAGVVRVGAVGGWVGARVGGGGGRGAVVGGGVLLGRSGGRIPLPIILGCGSGVMIGLGALYSRAFFLSLGAGLPSLAWVVFLPLMLFANLGGLWVQQAGFQQGRVLIVVAMNAVTHKEFTTLGRMLTH